MRMILLIVVALATGCGKSSPSPKVDPNENAVRFFDNTIVRDTGEPWPLVFRSGHLVVSVYPPVASKVKLEVEDAKGKWSPMDREAPLAQETMVVVPYRVSNISHKDAFKIDDRITVICKLVDWRDKMRQIGSLDNHRPDFDTADPVRVIAPDDGYLGGLVQNRPFELANGRSVAGAAAFRLSDIAILLDGGGDENLAIYCRVASEMTDDVASVVVDVPASFVVPKESAQK